MNKKMYVDVTEVCDDWGVSRAQKLLRNWMKNIFTDQKSLRRQGKWKRGGVNLICNEIIYIYTEDDKKHKKYDKKVLFFQKIQYDSNKNKL